MKELYKAYQTNTLTSRQKDIFIKPRPEEELYDCIADPFQFDNIMNKPENKVLVEKLS